MARSRNNTAEHIASDVESPDAPDASADRGVGKKVDEARVSRRYVRLLQENQRDFLNNEIDIKDCNRMASHLWKMATKAGVDERVRALMLESMQPLQGE